MLVQEFLILELRELVYIVNYKNSICLNLRLYSQFNTTWKIPNHSWLLAKNGLMLSMNPLLDTDLLNTFRIKTLYWRSWHKILMTFRLKQELILNIWYKLMVTQEVLTVLNAKSNLLSKNGSRQLKNKKRFCVSALA